MGEIGVKYVLYSWTADGVPERCRITLAQVHGASCYHCVQPIDGDALRLDAPDGDVYLLHRECACEGCSGFDRKTIDALFSEEGAER